MLFRKNKTPKPESYDKENWRPILKCSICNGEQIAGFQNIHTGQFKEECFIRTPAELLAFQQKYGIETDLPKLY